MNWYKIAQIDDTLENITDNSNDLNEVILKLKENSILFKIIKDVVSVYANNKIYIIDDALFVHDANEWIWTISS